MEIIKDFKNDLLKRREVKLVINAGKNPGLAEAAKIIGCDVDYMEKTRIDGNTVEIKPKKLDVTGKNIAILDDIISTGGTMAKSIIELKRQKAKKVLVACTHGLFIGDAKQKLLSSGCDEIISTDTIENEFSKVKSAPCISNILSKYFK